MTIAESGVIQEANSKIWNYLDKIFGIAGLLTGYEIVRNEIEVPEFLLDPRILYTFVWLEFTT